MCLTEPCVMLRRNKVVNHFSIMLQRRLKEQENGEDEEEEGEKGAKKKNKKKKKGGLGGDLRIHDLDDDLELSSDHSESSAGEGMREDTEVAETGIFFSQFYIHSLIFFTRTFIFLAFCRTFILKCCRRRRSVEE